MKKLVATILILLSLNSLAQLKKNEFTGGVVVHSRSGFIGGFNARYATRINKEWSRFYAFEVANVRNPKEIRIPTAASGTFILGKSNFLFSLRPQYGMEKLLFAKDPDQGVRVSMIGAIGPTIGIVKPYFVEYVNPNNNLVKEPYTEDVDLNSIIGNAGWFRGLGQSKINPGGHVKLSLMFEYSTLKNRVSAIEAGFMYEQLAKKVQQNPFIEGESSYVIAFVTLSFGKKL